VSELVQFGTSVAEPCVSYQLLFVTWPLAEIVED